MSSSMKKKDIYEQHYRANLKTANLKLQLKKAANDVCLQIELFFSRQNTDRGIFNIPDLKKKSGYKDTRTIVTSLEQINKLGVFYVRALSANKFIIFSPKESNLKFVEAIDSNNEEYLIWLIKHTKESGKINKILSEAKTKVSSLFSGIVTKHQHAEKQHAHAKKLHQHAEKQHDCAYSYLSQIGDYQVLRQVDNLALDLYSLNLYSLDHQSLEVKSKEKNLSKNKALNDDEFLNNSINETTTELIVNDDFNNSESKDTSETKDSLLRANDDVGEGQKENIPPARPADCGQNVDKENIYKRILAIGVKENVAKEIIETVKLEILKDYLSAVPVWRASGNIKNIPGFYYSSVKDPAKYPLPEEVLTEKKQAEKKKDSNKLREFCKFLGLDVTSTKEIIKGYVSSCKNIFMDKEKLKFKIYNESFNRWVDDHGPTEAEKIANANVRKVISELDKNRLLLEKVLAYLKINTDINHYNLLNIIKRANDKIEMQFAGV